MKSLAGKEKSSSFFSKKKADNSVATYGLISCYTFIQLPLLFLSHWVRTDGHCRCKPGHCVPCMHLLECVWIQLSI